VEQAVGNLVDNALRHGRPPVAVSAREAGDDLEIRVSDGGDGFPAEFAEQAFERFSRADTARARGGAGLGLSIVRAVARAHGGDAEIDGDASHTTVVMRLSRPSHP
jgi:signal transduction histidine kinase